MQQFIDYINSALPDKPGDKILYRFKKEILEEMNQRALDFTSRGIHNDKVMYDLVVSEHPDLKGEYAKYHAKEQAAYKAKRKVITNLVGSVIYLISLVTVFLGLSIIVIPHNWDKTWVIVVDGVLLWVDYLLMLGVIKFTSMKKIFHIIARIFLLGAVIIFTVAIFLLVIALTDIPRSWLIIIAGIILAFICDGIYAIAAKHRLAILSWLLYIPAIGAFSYIIVGALGAVKWSQGWILVPLALVIDLIIILISVTRNKLYKLEEVDVWNEN